MRIVIGSLVLGALAGFAVISLTTSQAEASWFTEEPITDAGSYEMTRQSIVIDALGVGHVVWAGADSWPPTSLYYGRFDETGWLGSEMIHSNGYSHLEWASIAIDPSAQTLHVVWSGFSEQDGIFYKKRNGESWSDDLLIVPSEHGVPSIAVDAEGHALVVWVSSGPHDHRVEYTWWDGSSWSTPELLSPGYDFSFDPVVTVGADGNFHVVFTGNQDYDNGVYYKRFDGVSWSTDVRLNLPNSGNPDPPFIAAAPDGKLRAVWSVSGSGNREVYSTLYDGVDWLEVERLTDDPAVSWNASVAFASASTARLIWSDERDDNFELYTKLWENGAWSAAERLTTTSDRSFPSAFAADATGGWHVVWNEHWNTSELHYGRLGVPAGAMEDLPVRTGIDIQSIPNPTSGVCTIEFLLDVETSVSVRLVDVTGRIVRHLLEGTRLAGEYRIDWDGLDDAGRALPAGTYFAKIEANGETRTARVALVR